MFTVLLHSSKTMSNPRPGYQGAQSEYHYSSFVEILGSYLHSISTDQIKDSMALSQDKALQTKGLLSSFNTANSSISPALDIFLGDIYSGLQAQSFTQEDRNYANDHLFILSGLYGILRALDEIQPYRLEMGYKLPGNAHDPSQLNITSLYDFWGDKIAQQLPKNQDIINLSAVEYTKAVLPYITGTKKIKPIAGHEHTRIITPKFLTISPKTGEPTFVTVHAKIARGAFARWLIQNRIEDINRLKDFQEIGYKYNKALSTPEEPVFVAKEFKGLGLSIRLNK